MNGLKLLTGFGAHVAGIKQEQVGVAQNGSERVADTGAHFLHVAAEQSLSLTFECGALGAMGTSNSVNTAKSFGSKQDESVGPAVLAGDGEDIRMISADGESFPLFGSEENDGSGGIETERREKGFRIAFAYRTEDDEAAASCDSAIPDVAGEDGNFGDVPFSLPARHNGAGEFRVVRNDQNALRSHESPKSNECMVFKARTAVRPAEIKARASLLPRGRRADAWC